MVVDFDLGDHKVRGSEVAGDRLACSLVSRNLLDVNGVFKTVDSGDFALFALVGPTSNLDGIVTVNGKRTDTVLGTELLRKGSAHNHTTDVRRSLEVLLPRLGARAGDLGVLLHAVTGMSKAFGNYTTIHFWSLSSQPKYIR